MKVIKTDFEGLFVIEPTVFEDGRGYFFESYSQKVLDTEGIEWKFVQDNQSKSSYGVVRGLHYQHLPHAQTKLIRALRGNILDVVVDIRKSSKTFGKVLSIELSAENKKQLLIPQGFAHGFSVLSDEAEILYKCDNFYNKPAEGGIRFDDPILNIDWKIPADKVIASPKDLELPDFNNCINNFE
ncbi:dTDP-4-dehydrorhamnose 3,5-epimerase [Bacteroidales bacterium]|nr:dTDP-4-dehydrorhamnose 3,5-epimerase [Bacteroidales bacterium]